MVTRRETRLPPIPPLHSPPSKWSNDWWRAQGVEPPRSPFKEDFTPLQRAIYERAKAEERAGAPPPPPEGGIGGMATGLETVWPFLKGVGRGVARTALGVPPQLVPGRLEEPVRRAREALAPRTEAEAMGQIAPSMVGGLFGLGMEEFQPTGSFGEALMLAPGPVGAAGRLPFAFEMPLQTAGQALGKVGRPLVAQTLRQGVRAPGAVAERMIAGQPRIAPERVAMGRAPKKPVVPAAKEAWQMTKVEFYPTVTSRPEETRLKSFDAWAKENAIDPNIITEPIREAMDVGVDILMRKEPPSVVEKWWTEQGLSRLSAERQAIIKRYLSEVPSHVEQRALTSSQADQAYVRVLHRRAVRQALSEGKPVPAEVLRDYPDLAKNAPAKVARPRQAEGEAGEKLKTDWGSVIMDANLRF